MIKDNKKKIVLTILTLLFVVSLIYHYNYIAVILAVLDLVILWERLKNLLYDCLLYTSRCV